MSSSNWVTSAAGVRMPAIIYGTAWKKERTADLVRRALDCGFRGVDTACQPRHYNEAGVGEGVAAFLRDGMSRADLYLQTKFTSVDGQAPDRIPYDPAAPLAEQVAESFATSLRNLQTDYLDCLVLHSPLRRQADTAEVWQSMEAIVDQGGAAQIGLSNCYGLAEFERLYDSARIKPAVLQNRFYADTQYDRELRAFCKAHGIIYQSFWTLSANPQVLGSNAVTSLAAKHQRTPAQILFRWLTQEDVVPLTGTKSEDHMREDLSIFEFELMPDERESVRALLA